MKSKLFFYFLFFFFLLGNIIALQPGEYFLVANYNGTIMNATLFSDNNNYSNLSFKQNDSGIYLQIPNNIVPGSYQLNFSLNGTEIQTPVVTNNPSGGGSGGGGSSSSVVWTCGNWGECSEQYERNRTCKTRYGKEKIETQMCNPNIYDETIGINLDNDDEVTDYDEYIPSKKEEGFSLRTKLIVGLSIMISSLIILHWYRKRMGLSLSQRDNQKRYKS